MAAYKRKRVSRRATRSKRRRVMKKRVRRTRRARRGGNVPRLSIKKSMFVGTFTPGTTSAANFWNYVTPTLGSAGTIATTALTGVANIDQYYDIFDVYKLNAVKLEFKPKIVNLTMPEQVDSTLFVRQSYYASIIMDPKNSTVPTGIFNSTTYNNFREQGNARMVRGDKPFSVFLKPMVSEQYGGGAVRYIKPAWTSTDAAGKSLQYRGFHIFFHNQEFNVNFNSYDVYATYYLQFKGLK